MYEPPCNHDHGGMNVLYADGHVDFIPMPTAKKIIAELHAGHNPPREDKLK
jgi:prepilin-type processing-associated H-X9-DG protein